MQFLGVTELYDVYVSCFSFVRKLRMTMTTFSFVTDMTEEEEDSVSDKHIVSVFVGYYEIIFSPYTHN